mmetsp:Transcript_43414/g.104236  ORF Transcript_43414/g.104236 Transcript_43414/m.104236 type:complete len:208 (-) Transcript_43414:1854-2477(-)
MQACASLPSSNDARSRADSRHSSLRTDFRSGAPSSGGVRIPPRTAAAARPPFSLAAWTSTHGTITSTFSASADLGMASSRSMASFSKTMPCRSSSSSSGRSSSSVARVLQTQDARMAARSGSMVRPHSSVARAGWPASTAHIMRSRKLVGSECWSRASCSWNSSPSLKRLAIPTSVTVPARLSTVLLEDRRWSAWLLPMGGSAPGVE